MKIGICIAMQEEADNLLSLVRLTEKRVKEYDNAFFYDSDNLTVAVGGVGTLASAMATQMLITKYSCDMIYNIGCAGCTGTKFSVGDILSINKLYKNDVDLTLVGCEPNQLSHTPTYLEAYADESCPLATCCSGDKFITSGSGIPADTVTEMEGFSVAYVCYKYGLPCRIYKIISDTCDKNVDASEYEANMQGVSDKLGQYIYEIISKSI